MDEITRTFSERGDLAHLALFLWATGSSGLLFWALRELAASNRRFTSLVRLDMVSFGSAAIETPLPRIATTGRGGWGLMGTVWPSFLLWIPIALPQQTGTAPVILRVNRS